MDYATLPLDHILFLDIETVPQNENYSDMSERFRDLWDKKSRPFRSAEETGEEVYQRAGIYAEFGKIVCVSVGMAGGERDHPVFRLKSFFGHDEAALLKQFAQLLEKLSGQKDLYLCGHNAKEFDFPYLSRRMIVNRISLPTPLQLAGKKPWEIKHLDTMELWKFGDYKSYTSLDLLTALFDIPTPKNDIDGSQVAEVYYKEKDLNRIVRYCEQDVLALAQVFLRYRNAPLFDDSQVSSATEWLD